MVGMCAMTPSALQIVNSIRWSFEQAIVPELSDPLTQSYARSIMAALDVLEVRLPIEGQLLLEEAADLREVLRSVRPVLPDDVAAAIDDALEATADPVAPFDLQGATARADRLRSAAAAVIASQPHDDGGVLRAYLGRQLERERRLQPAV